MALHPEWMVRTVVWSAMPYSLECTGTVYPISYIFSGYCDVFTVWRNRRFSVVLSSSSIQKKKKRDNRRGVPWPCEERSQLATQLIGLPVASSKKEKKQATFFAPPQQYYFWRIYGRLAKSWPCRKKSTGEPEICFSKTPVSYTDHLLSLTMVGRRPQQRSVVVAAA